MKRRLPAVSLFLLTVILSAALQAQETINLNGTWQFDQTLTAFPPAKFTRTIPVPGLISLAQPRIEQYDAFFKRPDKPVYKSDANFFDLDYTPKYSWYKKTVTLPANLKGKEAVLTIRKSQYVTQVFVNGRDMGTSISCFTPIVLHLDKVLQYGQPNEILIKIGDRAWLPPSAAGGTDKEKEHYIPGIWDDVFLTFSEKFQLHKGLLLPNLETKSVTAKFLIRNFNPAQTTYGGIKTDKARIDVQVTEKASGKTVATIGDSLTLKRDDNTTVQLTLPMVNPHLWTPDDPFLYTAKVRVYNGGKLSDERSYDFGMRSFERTGKYFYLNGQRTYLRGSNITLQRFFEDPESGALAWDRQWVEKMFIDYAKKLNWNTYRICVGLVPDFWYDLADKHGILLQNEWMYWQDHGWDQQIRTEYTDWVWSDGNHPSIVIWDGINENWNTYIGNKLIPELKQLDPTRVWDAGYMTSKEMTQDEMDEPHPYMNIDIVQKGHINNDYPLGHLDYTPASLETGISSSQAQLVNEYGWVWTWRDGQPSKLTLPFFKYFVGNDLTEQKTRSFQAYLLQLETEWLRSHRELAGVLAFTHLTNNYGYTGDWFTDIKTLAPNPTLKWFRHCFAPSAVFINLMDERYMKQAVPHALNEQFSFSLVGVNDLLTAVNGKVNVDLYNSEGKSIFQKAITVKMDPISKQYLPVILTLPGEAGGYTLMAEFAPDGSKDRRPVISRRYLKVGQASAYRFYEGDPGEIQ